MVKVKQTNYLTTILAVGLIIVAIVLAANNNTQTVSNEERNRVSVSGTASITVDPDKAEVFVKILTLEETAQESKNENSRISSKVMRALNNEGVKTKDIETSQFSIFPRYEYEEVVENGVIKSKRVLVG